jgi:hypothetical protein
MHLARALIFSTPVVTAIAFAQDAPDDFRFRAERDAVIEYGGKSTFGPVYNVSFATGPGGARVPDDVMKRLKTAFERNHDRLPIIGRSGSSTTFFNSKETVFNVFEDGTRTVQVEFYAQAAGMIGVGQTTDAAYTRIYAPDGSVTSGEASVKIETSRPLSGDEAGDDRISRALEQGVQANIASESLILGACYQTPLGTVRPLMLDPTLFTSFGEEPPAETQPIRLGDVRLERSADGMLECRTNVEPGRYGTNVGPVKIIWRQLMRFDKDGVLERREFVSSTILNRVEATDFDFEGKTYRVRYVTSYRSVGAEDRL